MTASQKIPKDRADDGSRAAKKKVSRSFNTRRDTGLTSDEVKESRALYGSNQCTAAKRVSFFKRFLSNLGDPIIKTLICALIVNLVFSHEGADMIESLGIALSILLATLISTVSEYGSENAFSRLSEQYMASKSRVRRDGKVLVIPSSELVCGDIVLLSAGERIPADGTVLYGTASVDQSPLTGEPAEIHKAPSRDASLLPAAPSSLCGGCLLLSGECEMTVQRVGEDTAIGRISLEIQEDKRESPLKLRLSALARQISLLGYLAAAAVAVIYLLNAIVFNSGSSQELIMLKLTDPSYMLSTLLDALTLGLTVVVMAVPEGLPMMVAVVLSSNIKRMAKDSILVRKPTGIEAAGSLNILFTDKTGTLTHGKMKVSELILADLTSLPSVLRLPKASRIREDYLIGAAFNNSATESPDGAVGGNPTDRAMLESCGRSIPKNARITGRLAFDSERKFSAVSILDTVTSKSETYVKGAPERLLPFVTECLCADDSICSFEIYRRPFLERLDGITKKGARVILTAKAINNPSITDEVARGKLPSLRLICAVVLSDGLRAEASASVKKLQGAGIQVVMITGDNKATAAEIAKKCGILTKDVDLCLTSKEMEALSDEELTDMLPRLCLVARALPEDKSRLVRIAERRGLVVGMTGDGINDAPALRRADVGFAMGSGTQVAKEAGDIIILDNDLSSIVKAVLYGRTIFKSIRKFIVLQLTMNLCAVGVSILGPFIGVDAPVTVIQMLWINVIMDTLGGLAFAGEPALSAYLKERPKRRDEPIINRFMMKEILLLGASTLVILISFLVSPSMIRHFRASEDNIYHLTAFFALFIFSGVFNCFNARTDSARLFSGISGNRAFVMIMTAVCAVQLAFVYLGGSVLRTAPLTASELKYTLLIALLVFPITVARRLISSLGAHRGGY